MTSVREAIADLVAVPGVRGMFLASSDAPARIYRLDHELSAERVDGLVRGLLAVLRRLGTDVSRVELRYEGGRFVLTPLRGGVVAAVITDARPNLPLLQLGLDALRAAADLSESDVLRTFRADEQPGGPRRAEASTPKSSTEGAAELPRPAASPKFELLRSEPPPPSSDLRPSAPRSEARADGEERVAALRTRASTIPPSTWSSARSSTRPSARPPGAAGDTTHQDLARALTAVSQTASRFLGRSVLANYWRQTQQLEGVGEWTVSSDAQIEAVEPESPAMLGTRERAERWAAAFVARCSLIVEDLPGELRASADPDALALLTRTRTEPARYGGIAR